jgi:hypothetical protein
MKVQIVWASGATEIDEASDCSNLEQYINQRFGSGWFAAEAEGVKLTEIIDGEGKVDSGSDQAPGGTSSSSTHPAGGEDSGQETGGSVEQQQSASAQGSSTGENSEVVSQEVVATTADQDADHAAPEVGL